MKINIFAASLALVLLFSFTAAALDSEESGASKTNSKTKKAPKDEAKPAPVQMLFEIKGANMKPKEKDALFATAFKEAKKGGAIKPLTEKDIKDSSDAAGKSKTIKEVAKEQGIKFFAAFEAAGGQAKGTTDAKIEFDIDGKISVFAIYGADKAGVGEFVKRAFTEVPKLIDGRKRTDSGVLFAKRKFGFFASNATDKTQLAIMSNLKKGLAKLFSEPFFSVGEVNADDESMKKEAEKSGDVKKEIEKDLADCPIKPCQPALATARGVCDYIIFNVAPKKGVKDKYEASLTFELAGGRVMTLYYYLGSKEATKAADAPAKFIKEIESLK